MQNNATQFKPSWLRWPPNCCETCTGWQKKEEWVGNCERAASIHCGERTDARQRCPNFERKPDS